MSNDMTNKQPLTVQTLDEMLDENFAVFRYAAKVVSLSFMYSARSSISLTTFVSLVQCACLGSLHTHAYKCANKAMLIFAIIARKYRKRQADNNQPDNVSSLIAFLRSAQKPSTKEFLAEIITDNSSI